MYGNYMNYPYFMPNNNAMPDMLSQQKMAYQAPQSNDMIWVLSKTEAESFPVAPNTTVVMWDKNSPTIYVKSVDGNRTPSFRTLDFKERIENAPNSPVESQKDLEAKFLKRDEFEALQTKFESLNAKVDKLLSKEDEEV